MYAKVFSQILDSSIANNYELRHFFTDMLILAEIDGVVDMTPEAIAARTRIPIGKVIGFLKQLSEPDPRSRSDVAEGRRIVLLDDHRDWGWQIVNYIEYRKIASDEQRREKTKNRTRKWRDTKRVTPSDAPVTPCDASDAMQRQRQRQIAEAEAKADEGTFTRMPNCPKDLAEVLMYCEMQCITSRDGTQCYDYFEAAGWYDKNGQPIRNWRAKVRSWKNSAENRQAERAHFSNSKPKGTKPDYEEGF